MESPEKNTGKEEREKLQEDIRQIYLTLGTEADDEDAYEEEDSEDDALNIDTDFDENSQSQHGSLVNSCQESESLQEDASYIIREMDAEESSQWEPTTDICLQLNVAYQNLLVELLQKIELSLAENRERQTSLEAEVAGKSVKKLEASENYSISLRLIPFFKDADHRIPPPNQDILTKRWMNELKQNMAPPRSWNSSERKKLVECVKTDTLAKLMRPHMNRKELYLEKMEKCETEDGRDELKQKIKCSDNDVFKVKLLSDAEIFPMVDVDKVDWLKISNMDFDGHHDHIQCKMMWLNGVRPGINRASWSQEENAKLNELVEKHERRNWPMIAEELGTGRIAFQCLQHYQKTVKSDLNRTPWTSEEDCMMLEIIDTCKIANRIPWTQISYYMEGRSPNNCFSRWRAMDPTVRHGKWTEKEDKLLMTAIRIFGVGNWSRAAACVPGRNSSQCRDRWNNSVDPTLTLAPFTYEEDKLVLTMTKAGAHKLGWHNVTSCLPGRTDNMVYQRYKRLLRWQQMDDWYQRQTDESRKYYKEKYSTLARDPETSKIMDEKSQIWAEIDRQQGILETDYEKQERDRLAGDIVVPRPPRNTRKPSIKIAKLIARREKMQQHLLNVVDPLILEEAHKHLSNSQPNSDQSERFKNHFVSIISQVHHSMTVHEMLKLARELEKGVLMGKYRVGQTEAQKIKKKNNRSKQRAIETSIAKVLTFYIRQKRQKCGRPSRLLGETGHTRTVTYYHWRIAREKSALIDKLWTTETVN